MHRSLYSYNQREIAVKIIVITFWRVPHPGAALQAYSLVHALRALGHDCRMLCYEEACPKPLGIKSAILRLLSVGRRRKYGKFQRDYLYLTDQEYVSWACVQENPPSADVYICGSDQIWNPDLLNIPGHRLNPAFMLDFGAPEVRRIAYGVSTGGYSFPEDLKKDLRNYCKRFAALSFREQDTAVQMEEILGMKSEVVLDPTFLVEDFSNLLIDRRPEPAYILIYDLQSSPLILSVARRLAKSGSYKILRIDGSYRAWDRDVKDVRPDSPQEWLTLIRNAAIVLTNSFHGIVFSILFQRNFHYVVANPDNPRNNRVFNLLKLLNLEDRIVSPETEPQSQSIACWTEVAAILAARRKQSIDFLVHSLQAPVTNSVRPSDFIGANEKK